MEATGFDIRKDVRPFGIRDKIGYALGDLGCNLSFSLISAFMLDFYTQYIGIPGAIWAVIIIVTKVWDGVNDPIMGGIMDSVRIGRSGSKFKPWMSIAAIGLTVTGALVFLPVPNAALWLKVALCIVTYLLWDICYTLMNVPYGSLSAAITADPLERTSLSTWRSIGAAIGGGISMLLPLLLYDDNQNLNGDILIWVALAMGAVALVVYILCLWPMVYIGALHLLLPVPPDIVNGVCTPRLVVILLLFSTSFCSLFKSCPNASWGMFQTFGGYV